MKRLFPVVGLFLLGMILTGCGDGNRKKPLPRMEVKGVVEMDGKPMPDGEIYFEDGAGGPPKILPIKDGKFVGKVEMEPGEKKVAIYAYREGKLPPTATTTEIPKENYIPERFNAQSTMKATLKIEGPNEFNFKVETR